ncbi:hypothetical protein Smic_23280 [Streptomyces microflavus]|uniref:MFS transporter n=1 Tax=Streptomyces microflavus TaxID=1919 RepID=A0A7J0CMN9_STRMI|nr:hypothetical protein Smic_23280 [Streptomyces microflavus]
MSSRPRAAWPLVAVFTAGYLASYLLPTIVGRLSVHLGLSPAQAGLVGSALLLSSASAGFTLAGRVERYGSRTPARAGLVLAVVGYGCAALAGSVPLVVLAVVVGGFGSGRRRRSPRPGSPRSATRTGRPRSGCSPSPPRRAPSI